MFRFHSSLSGLFVVFLLLLRFPFFHRKDTESQINTLTHTHTHVEEVFLYDLVMFLRDFFGAPLRMTLICFQLIGLDNQHDGDCELRVNKGGTKQK